MTLDATPYTNLITSEHAQKPNFVATVAALVSPFVDTLNLLQQMDSVTFDVDTAIGVQLDAVGVRVGCNRNIPIPLTNVYFSFGIAGLGFSEGAWFTPGDPTTGLTVLPDSSYRTLIKATIASNQWDGTYETAYTVWNDLFSLTGVGILLQFMSPLEIIAALTGRPDVITASLFGFGLLDLRPCTVRYRSRLVPSVYGRNYFGFWPNNQPVPANSPIAGFGQGAWGTPIINGQIIAPEGALSSWVFGVSKFGVSSF